MLIDFGAFAYGFWRYTEDKFDLACAMIEQCRTLGITHLDTADIYGNESGIGAAERLLGRMRREAPALLKGMSIATKGGIVFGTPYNSSKDYLSEAVDASLKRMDVEQIELYYIHRPDILTHPEELARSLEDLVRAGKVQHLAVSNFTAAQVSALQRFLNHDIFAHQIELSVLHTDPISDGRLDQAMAEGMAVPVWSPLAGGQIYTSDAPAAVRVRTVLEELADRLDRTVTQVALAFVRTHPAKTIPILGTMNKERLAESVGAQDLILERPDWYKIYEAALGERLP